MGNLLDAFISIGLGGLSSSNATNPISKFHKEIGRYPGNNKVWWVAKAQADDDDKKIKAGDFLPKVLDKTYSGNTRVARGHYLLNAFRKDRSAASGIFGFPIEVKPYRPNATCFFSGRVWWAAADRVYYSQILDHKSKAGLCYQEADPTSEDISDLIATDGGLVPIPEAQNIQRIIPMASGVMVFASTGVWFIGSGDNAFSATDLVLDKVSAIGTEFPKTIISVGDLIFWWSEVGIHALEQASGQFGPIPGKFGNDNIAEQTIQSFYNDIPEECKKNAKVVYDPKTNVVQWLYSNDANTPRIYTHVLNFDVTLQAFYPWEFSQYEENGPKVRGVILDRKILVNTFEEDVVTTSGETVTETDLEVVETEIRNNVVEDRPTNITYVITDGVNLTFGQVNNQDFVDWESYDGVGLPYTSFMETGYEILNDAMRKKQTPRVFIHFRRTEDDPSEPPSSCKFRTKWDWTSSANSNKWSREIEAYRPKTMRLPTTADFESGMPVVISNNKVRGSGKSIQFRFECSEAGKNFDLLGWSVAYAGNTEP